MKQYWTLRFDQMCRVDPARLDDHSSGELFRTAARLVMNFSGWRVSPDFDILADVMILAAKVTNLRAIQNIPSGASTQRTTLD